MFDPPVRQDERCLPAKSTVGSNCRNGGFRRPVRGACGAKLAPP